MSVTYVCEDGGAVKREKGCKEKVDFGRCYGSFLKWGFNEVRPIFLDFLSSSLHFMKWAFFRFPGKESLRVVPLRGMWGEREPIQHTRRMLEGLWRRPTSHWCASSIPFFPPWHSFSKLSQLSKVPVAKDALCTAKKTVLKCFPYLSLKGNNRYVPNFLHKWSFRIEFLILQNHRSTNRWQNNVQFLWFQTRERIYPRMWNCQLI